MKFLWCTQTSMNSSLSTLLSHWTPDNNTHAECESKLLANSDAQATLIRLANVWLSAFLFSFNNHSLFTSSSAAAVYTGSFRHVKNSKYRRLEMHLHLNILNKALVHSSHALVKCVLVTFWKIHVWGCGLSFMWCSAVGTGDIKYWLCPAEGSVCIWFDW